MVFNHLVDPPRLIPGGISFTVNELVLGQTVFVTDAAIEALAPAAHSGRERLAFVMTHMPQLTEAALRKASRFAMPELIVLEAADLVGLAG